MPTRVQRARFVPAPTVVAFDAVGPSSAGASSTASTALSWSHTCTGSNRLLVVGVTVGISSGTPTITGVTYAGVAMTSVGKINANNGSFGFVQLFQLVAPSTGANTVSVTATATPATMEGGSVSFTGVNQSVPMAAAVTAAGSSTTPSATVTGTTAGNIVVDAACCGSAFSADTQTLRWRTNVNGNTGGGNGCMSTAAGGGSVTMAHTAASDTWGVVAVEVLSSGTVAEASGGTTLFTDDFATGNFSKWGFLEWNSGGTIRQSGGSAYSGTGEYSGQIVAVDGRAQVARFELRDGDIPFSTTERAEMSHPNSASTDAVPNDERWVAWDMKFDSTWPVLNAGSGWCVIQQWHQATGSASPAVCLDVDTDDVIYLANNDATGFQRTAVQAVVRNTWQRWVMHIKFSENAAVGYVDLWVDGVLKINHEFRKTLIPGDTSCYLKTGIYRDPVNTATGILYFDNFKITSP